MTPIIPGPVRLAGCQGHVHHLKRHEREKQELIHASNRLTDAILKTGSLGLFLLDANGKMLPQVSNHLGALFRRQDFANLSFEKLIGPLVSAKTLSVARNYVGAPARTAPRPEPRKPIRSRTWNCACRSRRHSRGGALLLRIHRRAKYRERAAPWIVRVADITAREQQQRELVDLRVQVRTQGEILRSVLQAGGTRFGAFLQRTDASMKTINNVLKKPAREAGAFRSKLEETLEEVDRIRRDAAALKLSGLQSAAREFEDALQELRSRESLSGSDFLPLAVKLDALYGQFASLRALTSQAGPARDAEPRGARSARHRERHADHRIAEVLRRDGATAHAPPQAQRMAPAGSLESTLATLTDWLRRRITKPWCSSATACSWCLRAIRRPSRMWPFS